MDLSYVVAVHLIFVEAKKEIMLTKKQVMAAFSTVQERYADELGVDLQLKKTTMLKRDFSRRQRFSVHNSFKRFAKAYNYTFSRGWYGDNVIKLYVLPGLQEGKVVYAGGIANGCTYKSAKFPVEKPPVAVVFSPPSQRINAEEIMAVTMEHEIGHNLCANHYDGVENANVMHEAALAFIDDLAVGITTGIPDFLKFAPFSVKEIHKYLDTLM